MTDDERIVRRLDRAHYSRPSYDGILDFLLSVGRSGFSVPLGLIVDGVPMRGATIPVEQFVEGLRQGFESLAEAFPETGESTLLIASGVEQVNTMTLEQHEKDRAALDNYEPGDEFDSIHTNDVAPISRALAPPFALHLRNASCFVGDEWRTIGVVRVRFDKIGAWWPLESEQGLNVNYVDSP